MTEDDEGEWGDAWIYEDKVIYVQKKFVAIPKSATQGDDVSTFDKTVMTMTATTYDDMRPGLLGRQGTQEGLRDQLGRRLAAVPHVPALLRPDVLRGRRPRARARVRAGVQRLDGRGVVRPLHRHQHPARHHPAVGPGARVAGDPAQRGARRARGVLLRAADPPRPAERAHRALGPDARGVQRHRHHAVHARGLVVDRPVLVARRAPGRGQHGRVQQLDGVARRLPLRRDHAPLPEAEDRVLRGPDRLAAVRARAGRHGVGGAQRLAELQAPVPRAAVDLLLRPRLRLLHVGPPRREVARRGG